MRARGEEERERSLQNPCVTLSFYFFFFSCFFFLSVTRIYHRFFLFYSIFTYLSYPVYLFILANRNGLGKVG